MIDFTFLFCYHNKQGDFMMYLNLEWDDILSYISNEDNIIDQGMFGTLYEFDNDTLIKLYCREFLTSYKSLDINDFNMDSKDRLNRLKKLYNNLKNSKTNDLFKGIILNRNYVIGVLLKYFKDYYSLEEYYDNLSKSEKVYIIDNVRYLIYDLMNNGVYPQDINERNVLINKNLNVKIIDLDGFDVIVEDKDYIITHPNIEKICNNRIYSMEYRLKHKEGIIL